jgi:hypothetical protein
MEHFDNSVIEKALKENKKSPKLREKPKFAIQAQLEQDFITQYGKVINNATKEILLLTKKQLDSK